MKTTTTNTSTPNTTSRQDKGLTQARQVILVHLAMQRFATTKQINTQLQADKVVQHTLGDLDWLRKQGMVRSFPYTSPQGGRPSLCWLLQRPGAYAIGQTWAGHYDREPSNDTILYRDWQIKLEQHVKSTGWQLLEPAPVSPSRPLPTQTPQYERLVSVLAAQQSTAIDRFLAAGRLKPGGQTLVDYERGSYKLKVAPKANDYVAYREAAAANSPIPARPPLAIVLILAHRDATENFWAGRVELYKRLIGKLPIIALFALENQAYASRDYLKRSGLEVKTFNQLRFFLQEMRQTEPDYEHVVG